MAIKAIETEYNGYKFRSRLEARWAVFFDTLGIKYEYEPEGYYGFDDTKYLPDFRLRIGNENVFAEVKGCDTQLDKDWQKIANSIDFASTPISSGLLILGDIPNPNEIGYGKIPIFSYLYYHEGIVCDYAAFASSGKKIIFGITAISNHMIRDLNQFNIDYSDCVNQKPSNVTTEIVIFDVFSSIKTRGDALLSCAYKKARQALFEYGETPVMANE